MASNGDIDARLASRAEDPAEMAQRRLIWDVLSNLYDPVKNPNGIISLGVAENALMHAKAVAYFKAAMADFSDFSLTYGDGAFGSKRLNKALVRFINRWLKPIVPVESQHLTVTNGLTTSIEVCAFAIGDPGDGFLLGRPYYGSFPSDLGTRAGIKTVGVSFDDTDPLSTEGVQCYEKALIDFEKNNSGKIRALILCHPHNPLGRCYSKETIIEIMKFCNKYKIHLISDEIYALSVWENPRFPDAAGFVSVLGIDLEGIIELQLVHVLWGLSKDFGANGLRIGVTVSQHNPAFMATIQSYGLFTYPSAPSDHMAATLLEDEAFVDEYVRENQKRLAEGYTFVTDFLRRHDITFVEGSNAAFFVWVDLGRSWGKKGVPKDRSTDGGPGAEQNSAIQHHDENLTAKIMEKLLAHKVYLASGNAFGSEKQGWIRIVFSQPRPMVEEGLKRMLQAIEDS